MLLKVKFNDTAQKMLWAEAVHTCKFLQKIMAATGSTKGLFGIFYGEKPKIIGLFLEFGHIEYIIKRENIKKKNMDKTYK